MKTYIITGTSSGLGKAFLERLSREDAQVVSISRRFLPEQVALAGAAGGRVRLVQQELTALESLPQAEAFAEWIGDAEEVVFINNAAVVEPIGKIGELDAAKLVQAVEVNVSAAMQLTNALFAVPQVATGRIKVKVLNISSGAAKRPIGGWAVYCAVKAGNEMFFDVLAEQYAENANVEVHQVNPGVMDTEMQSKIRSAEFPTKARFVGLKEQGQLPTPEAVAEKIAREYNL